MKRLIEIERRLVASTPGEYEYIRNTRLVKQVHYDKSKIATIAKWNDSQEHADGDFFANAPTDIRYLLDENAKLQAVVKLQREALEYIKYPYPNEDLNKLSIFADETLIAAKKILGGK